jgi:hypothetical protein
VRRRRRQRLGGEPRASTFEPQSRFSMKSAVGATCLSTALVSGHENVTDRQRGEHDRDSHHVRTHPSGGMFPLIASVIADGNKGNGP